MENHDFLGAALKLIEEAGSQRALRSATAFIARLCRCETAATFAEENGSLKLVASYQIEQPALDIVKNAWTQSREQFRRGVHFTAAHTTIVPLLIREEFAGLFLLHSDSGIAGNLDLRAFGALFDLVAKLVRTPSIEVQNDWVPLDHEAVEREQLIHLLDQHEWNLARVARAKDVSRPTIYAWMDRLGIERKHVRAVTGYALRQKS